jgi:hypothetical protein
MARAYDYKVLSRRQQIVNPGIGARSGIDVDPAQIPADDPGNLWMLWQLHFYSGVIFHFAFSLQIICIFSVICIDFAALRMYNCIKRFLNLRNQPVNQRMIMVVYVAFTCGEIVSAGVDALDLHAFDLEYVDVGIFRDSHVFLAPLVVFVGAFAGKVASCHGGSSFVFCRCPAPLDVS